MQAQAHVLRQVFLQYRLSCFGVVSRHPTNSFPTCCDRISMGQQRSHENFRAYLRQELSIFLLIFLHVILRRYVQPRGQCRSKPRKEPEAAPYVPDFHWYGEYLAYGLKQLKSPAVIYSVYRFCRRCLRLPVFRYTFFDPSQRQHRAYYQDGHLLLMIGNPIDRLSSTSHTKQRFVCSGYHTVCAKQ